ncbi:MAG TPA: hypothetical protein VEU29_05025 [Actinomycetota bacterium]|nr:hypothetical protein [Actinomycetota bacterium]
MHLKRTTCALALAVAVALPLVAAPPASATVTGNVTFRCSMVIQWPMTFGHGACQDSLAGGVVSVAGTDTDDRPYSVHGVGGFSTTFDYTVVCLATEPGLAAIFQGRGTVHNVAATHDGVVTTADVSFDYQWVVGAVAGPVVVTGWTVTFRNGAVATGTTGAGAATFVPLAGAANTCPAPGGVMQAHVTGNVSAVL